MGNNMKPTWQQRSHPPVCRSTTVRKHKRMIIKVEVPSDHRKAINRDALLCYKAIFNG